MALIFVTRRIPEIGLTKLREAGHELVVSEKDGVLTREEMISELSKKSYEGILSLLTDKIDKELIEAVPTVKLVSNYAVGYNNIAVNELKEIGVTSTNVPGVLTDTVAEFTVSLILAITKRIVEADKFTRVGKYEGWAPELMLGTDLKGKTLGIVGAGRIGSEVAKRMAHGFGMEIKYSDVSRSEKLEEVVGCSYCESLEELLETSDVVSLHAPLLPSTHHLINAKRLALMKLTAYLINTSRGPLIDEKALVEVLKDNKIKGAALDVFENEPELAAGLKDLPNVILTPHIASASEETRDKMAEIVSENMIAFFKGEVPPNILN
ncbi:MAG: D-glycerate dehydrogenase [Candidatus Paceibacterota bacterium]